MASGQSSCPFAQMERKSLDHFSILLLLLTEIESKIEDWRMLLSNDIFVHVFDTGITWSGMF